MEWAIIPTENRGGIVDMICQACFEEEAIEGESICQNCKDACLDDCMESMEELIEKIES